MAIYKYTLIKYAKAKSTWIIAIFAGVVVAFILGSYLPSALLNENASDAAVRYSGAVVTSVAGVTSFLGLFASVFAGFKAASMYRDEVEDGTFLVILSKPMRRSTIIFMKWVALQTVLIIYSVFVVICYIGGNAIFDKGNKIEGLDTFGISTFRSQAFKIGGLVLLIIYVVSLIFSSIALLISTKLSTGATIGISTALGIIIPITALIGTFTQNDQYRTVANRQLAVQKQQLDVINKTQFGTFFPGLPGLIKAIDDYENQESVQNIYKLGVATGDSDPFKAAWVIDFNYQLTQLASLAVESAIPDSARQLASDLNASTRNNSGRPTIQDKVSSTGKVATEDSDNSVMANLDKALQGFVSSDTKALSSQIINQVYDQFKLLSVIYDPTAKVNLLSRTRSEMANMANQVKGKVWDASAPAGDPKKLPFFEDMATSGKQLTVSDVTQTLSYLYDNDVNYFDLLDKKYDSDPQQDWSDSDYVKYARHQLNQLSQSLTDSLKTVKPIANFPQLTTSLVDNTINAFSLVINKLNNPVTSFLVNASVLSSATTDILSKQVVHDGRSETYQDWAESLVDPSTSSSLSASYSRLSDADQDAVVDLIAASLKGDLYQTKITSYVNNRVLMGVYIIIALGLVPIAYFVVRRQDFR